VGIGTSVAAATKPRARATGAQVTTPVRAEDEGSTCLGSMYERAGPRLRDELSRRDWTYCLLWRPRNIHGLSATDGAGRRRAGRRESEVEVGTRLALPAARLPAFRMVHTVPLESVPYAPLTGATPEAAP